MGKKNITEVPTEYEDTEIQFKFGCYKEKNPSACHNLAKFFNHIKREHKKAAEMYKQNCDEHKFSESCCEYGSLRAEGLFNAIPANHGVAFEYLQKGCDYGSGRSCYNLGVLATNKAFGPTPDIPKALSYFELACEKKHGGGCREIGAIYLYGEGPVKKDFAKGKQYLENACTNLRDWQACQMLSDVYKKGLDTPVNKELSDKYKRIAEHNKLYANDNWRRIF